MAGDALIVTVKRPKGEDGYKVFSVRVREEVVAQIDDIASQTGHSRNELVGTFLEFALERCIVDTPKKEIQDTQ